MTEVTEKTIYDLGLHESISANSGRDAITRVPGGWLYERWRFIGNDKYEPFAVVFVPFDNEFQPEPKRF